MLAHQPLHREIAAQREQETVGPLQDSRYAQRARPVNLDALLHFIARRARTEVGPEQTYQSLQRKPRLRRDDHDRNMLGDAKHPLADEQAGDGLRIARKEMRENKEPRSG